MDRSRVVVGIDVGKKGALCRLVDGVPYGVVMPLAGNKVDGHAIAMFFREQRPDLVAIEKVHAMPKQGVTSMFNFGEGYGIIQGVCQSLAIPFVLVPPKLWKNEVLKGTKKDKNAAIEYCTFRFPDYPLIPMRCRTAHDGLADALCIAKWGSMQDEYR